jgi:hypothetical protein
MAWSLNLYIHPASEETTGNLLIENAYPPPQNYLLAGRSFGFESSLTSPATSIDPIDDSDNPPDGESYGVVVPQVGKYLVELDLKASDNAQGLFNIDVQPQNGTANWASPDDIFADPPITREFTNIPLNSPSPNITIGTIDIQNVPEPSLLGFVPVAVAFFAARRLRSLRIRRGEF